MVLYPVLLLKSTFLSFLSDRKRVGISFLADKYTFFLLPVVDFVFNKGQDGSCLTCNSMEMNDMVEMIHGKLDGRKNIHMADCKRDIRRYGFTYYERMRIL